MEQGNVTPDLILSKHQFTQDDEFHIDMCPHCEEWLIWYDYQGIVVCKDCEANFELVFVGDTRYIRELK